MPRVVGIDPGTVSIDVCGLDNGQLVLDRSWRTAEALANPDEFIQYLRSAGEPDLVAGPSGYGLPLVSADEATDEDWRLAFLAAPGEEGGIGGLRHLARSLAGAGLRTLFLPGVVHLDTVPAHRKLNRVDLGTADKLCAAALAIAEQAERLHRAPADTALVLLELGGAFSAAVAVEGGRIVDGVGGTSGPLGWRSSGALDGEVAFLAGSISKDLLFHGGVESVAAGGPAQRLTALAAYIEGAEKAVRALAASASSAREIVLSGRHAADVADALASRFAGIAEVVPLRGFAGTAKQGAQGAAILADGLAGGRHRDLVETLRIRHAAGSVLDHLFVVDRAAARRRLGLDGNDQSG